MIVTLRATLERAAMKNGSVLQQWHHDSSHVSWGEYIPQNLHVNLNSQNHAYYIPIEAPFVGVVVMTMAAKARHLSRDRELSRNRLPGLNPERSSHL